MGEARRSQCSETVTDEPLRTEGRWKNFGAQSVRLTDRAGDQSVCTRPVGRAYREPWRKRYAEHGAPPTAGDAPAGP